VRLEELISYRFQPITPFKKSMDLGIISTYPPEDAQHDGASGVSWYSKNLVENISQEVDDITVFSNTEAYRKKDYEVKNSWERGIFYPLSLLTAIYNSEREIDLLNIQHEMFLYGGFLSAIMFPLFLIGISFCRVKKVVTLHNGLISKDKIDREFCKRQNLPQIPLVLKTGLHFYFRIISLLSQVIVHEDKFKKILVEDYGVKSKKVSVIPIGVSQNNLEDLEGERKNEILFFGFIAPYKGVKSLLDIHDRLQLEHDLILAGGKHPDSEDENYYSQYYQEIEDKASKDDKVKLTGFVEEEKIQDYFSKADLVILPYRDLFSSSGPLHQALSFEKPILASGEFEGIVKSQMTYNSNREAVKKISKILGGDKEKFEQLSSHMKSERTWDKVCKKHITVYNNLVNGE
jgi:glycosyltransferase involved in cell wall biosynthesis